MPRGGDEHAHSMPIQVFRSGPTVPSTRMTLELIELIIDARLGLRQFPYLRTNETLTT